MFAIQNNSHNIVQVLVEAGEEIRCMGTIETIIGLTKIWEVKKLGVTCRKEWNKRDTKQNNCIASQKYSLNSGQQSQSETCVHALLPSWNETCVSFNIRGECEFKANFKHYNILNYFVIISMQIAVCSGYSV